MLESMTGFVSHTTTLSLHIAGNRRDVSLLIELKTLNSRYFETSFKIPSILSHLELKMINMAKQKLIRGRIFCTVKSGDVDTALEIVSPVNTVIQQYVSAASMLSDQYGVNKQINFSDLLQAPGAFVAQVGGLTEDEEKNFLAAFEKALDTLTQVRKTEGEALQRDLLTRLGTCGQRVEYIDETFTKFFEQKKVEAAELHQANTQQEDPLVKMKIDELHSVLNKTDIQEEITRFKAHVNALNVLFTTKTHDEKGRRLDFTVQEMHREINTLSAKSVVFEINKAAIDVKVELEKMREQIQNIV